MDVKLKLEGPDFGHYALGGPGGPEVGEIQGPDDIPFLGWYIRRAATCPKHGFGVLVISHKGGPRSGGDNLDEVERKCTLESIIDVMRML